MVSASIDFRLHRELPVVDAHDVGDVVEQARALVLDRRIAAALDAEDHVVAGHRIAVVELGARAQPELVGEPVGTDFGPFGECRGRGRPFHPADTGLRTCCRTPSSRSSWCTCPDRASRHRSRSRSTSDFASAAQAVLNGIARAPAPASGIDAPAPCRKRLRDNVTADGLRCILVGLQERPSIFFAGNGTRNRILPAIEPPQMRRPISSDDLVPQARLAAPEPTQIVDQNVQHIVLVLPRFSRGMRRDQHIAEAPER